MDTISEENEEHERRLEERQERKANHRFSRAFNLNDGEDKKRERRREMELEKGAEKKQQKEDANTISKSLARFEVKDINNIPETGALTEIQTMNIYREIQDDCEQHNYPITVMELLPEIKSCIPPATVDQNQRYKILVM